MTDPTDPFLDPEMAEHAGHPAAVRGSDGHARRRALAAGFDEHLGKPFQLDAFVRAMERIEAARS